MKLFCLKKEEEDRKFKKNKIMKNNVNKEEKIHYKLKQMVDIFDKINHLVIRGHFSW